MRRFLYITCYPIPHHKFRADEESKCETREVNNLLVISIRTSFISEVDLLFYKAFNLRMHAEKMKQNSDK